MVTCRYLEGFLIFIERKYLTKRIHNERLLYFRHWYNFTIRDYDNVDNVLVSVAVLFLLFHRRRRRLQFFSPWYVRINSVASTYTQTYKQAIEKVNSDKSSILVVLEQQQIEKQASRLRQENLSDKVTFVKLELRRK